MQTIACRFGGYQEPASIHNRAAVYFAERLRHRLGDCLAFELVGNVLALGYPSGELPSMVERGDLDFCYIATVRFARWVPELRILELPFVVRDRPIAQRALMGQLGERFAQQLSLTSPYRLLGLWDNGFRHFTNRVRVIRTPEDCRGLRIRTQMSDIIATSLATLGFVAVPADIKEFLQEIDGGRYEAQENPLTNTYNFGVHRHHRYITLSGHSFGAAAMVCSRARYERWPAEVRAAVDESAAEATRYQHRLAAAEDDEILAKIDPAQNEIVRLTSSERAQFVAAVQPVIERHRSEFAPDLFEALGAAPD